MTKKNIDNKKCKTKKKNKIQEIKSEHETKISSCPKKGAKIVKREVKERERKNHREDGRDTKKKDGGKEKSKEGRGEEKNARVSSRGQGLLR